MKKSQLSVLVFGMFVIVLRAQDATRGAATLQATVRLVPR